MLYEHQSLKFTEKETNITKYNPKINYKLQSIFSPFLQMSLCEKASDDKQKLSVSYTPVSVLLDNTDMYRSNGSVF